jgi:hypothetical protein
LLLAIVLPLRQVTAQSKGVVLVSEVQETETLKAILLFVSLFWSSILILSGYLFTSMLVA